MNYKLALVQDLFKIKELILSDNKVIYRDPETKVDTVVAEYEDQDDALPKEVAIKHGFTPELNEHGARRSSYVDEVLNRLRTSSDKNERRAVDFLPKWFVFEDELNNPAPGTEARATLNKNDSMGVTYARLGIFAGPWQGADGAAVLDHVFIFLGDNHDKAVKQLAKVNAWFDNQVEKQIDFVTNNKRI